MMYDDDVIDEAQTVQEAIDSATSPAHEPERIDLGVVKLLVSRLAQIMAQEVDLLDAMKVTEIGALYEEKQALVDALEKYKKLLTRRQRVLEGVSTQEREELEELITIFHSVMEENHKRLLVAREVNARVVQVISEMANENAKHSYYTHTGERADDPSVCISLNRSI